MMYKQTLKALLFLALIVLCSASGCNDDTTPEPEPPQNIQLTFNLQHFVGASPVEFDQLKYTNAYGNAYSVLTLKYFISDIKFEKADGSGKIILDIEQYIDATNAQTTTFTIAGNFPNVEYSSISFVFGLTEEKNITGAFPNPPESNMEWPIPMGGGYHYMKLEGKLDSASMIKNYQAHTGASMGTPYYIDVVLPNSEFEASGNKTINIGMDINLWWADPNTLDLNNMSAVMGNQAMQQKLKDNGNDVFTLISIE